MFQKLTTWVHLFDITNIGWLIAGFVGLLVIEMMIEIGRFIVLSGRRDRELRQRLRRKIFKENKIWNLIHLELMIFSLLDWTWGLWVKWE